MTSGERMPAPRARRQRGMGYLLVLFAMAAIGIGLAGTGEVWRTSAQRERETELLFVGQQFRVALASYRDSSPPGTPVAPQSLDELLEDPRFPNARRHLRRLWTDPMSGKAEWGLVVAGGRIVGVHSLDTREPLRSAFRARDAELAGASSYAQWIFKAAEIRQPLSDPSVSPNAPRSPP